MTALKKTRSAQYPLTAEFTFNLTDTFVMTDATSKAFTVAAPVADVICLPPNAVVVGGDMTVETIANDSGTATIAVGDSASATRYLGATTIKTAARTALVPTGFRGAGEDIRITLANQNGDGTAGKVTVRVSYILTGRANEVQTT
jgi:hypothetical protein